MTKLTRSAADLMAEDMHFHSTFSDGAHSIQANVESALSRGLRRICCVDHVRESTEWVPEFVSVIERMREVHGHRLEIFSGIEAKFVDSAGRLDLPSNCEGVDFILAADHQVPTPWGYEAPQNMRSLLEAGYVDPETVIDWLVSAMTGSLDHYPSIIIAHPFSVLPKIGLSEDQVSDAALTRIAQAAVRSGARIELSERWHCPSLRAARIWASCGVDLVASTDAHNRFDIGCYDSVAKTVNAVLAPGETQKSSTSAWAASATLNPAA